MTRLRRLARSLFPRLRPIVTYHEDIRHAASLVEPSGFEHIHMGYWPDGKAAITSMEPRTGPWVVLRSTPEAVDFRGAQDRLCWQIQALLPPGVRRVLDVGGGIGATADQLRQAGYEVLCLVPDRALIALGRRRFPYVQFLRGTAEQFRVSRPYDAAVLLESYQYFTDRGRAGRNIVRHLAPASAVVVADEFSVAADGFPIEADLVADLVRQGYRLSQRLDATRNVVPTCAMLYGPAATVYGRAAEWKAKEEMYLTGQHRYLLLLFARNLG